MPYTPYHFGPSGFLGLVFRRWLDLPVFVLANVVVDLEVLITGNHRYFHTLLIGAAVGVCCAIAVYPLRGVFKWVMGVFRLPYRTGFLKMVVSGILGVWLHVLLDAIYHWDVRIFWPNQAKPLWRLLSKEQVEMVCVACFAAGVIVYLTAMICKCKRQRKSDPG